MNFGGFVFDGEEFQQHSGLAMGSPLSPVAACLYMERLEQDHFKRIMGTETFWARYIDDVIIVAPVHKRRKRGGQRGPGPPTFRSGGASNAFWPPHFSE